MYGWAMCRQRGVLGFPDSRFFRMLVRSKIQDVEQNLLAVLNDPIDKTGPDCIYIRCRNVALQTEAEEVDEIDEVIVALRVLESTS